MGYLLRCALDFPRLINSEFPHSTMIQATLARIGAVYQRYSPNTFLVVIIDYTDAEAGMVGAILVYITGSKRFSRFTVLLLRFVCHKNPTAA